MAPKRECSGFPTLGRQGATEDAARMPLSVATEANEDHSTDFRLPK